MRGGDNSRTAPKLLGRRSAGPCAIGIDRPVSAPDVPSVPPDDAPRPVPCSVPRPAVDHGPTVAPACAEPGGTVSRT